MSDIETPEVTFEAPAPRKKPAKKAKAKPRVAEPKQSVAFAGLTRTACASACNAKGCVISGRNYCAHPTKGGLQAVDQNNAAALRRLQEARDQIAVRVDPDRFK